MIAMVARKVDCLSFVHFDDFFQSVSIGIKVLFGHSVRATATSEPLPSSSLIAQRSSPKRSFMFYVTTKLLTNAMILASTTTTTTTTVPILTLNTTTTTFLVKRQAKRHQYHHDDQASSSSRRRRGFHCTNWSHLLTTRSCPSLCHERRISNNKHHFTAATAIHRGSIVSILLIFFLFPPFLS